LIDVPDFNARKELFKSLLSQHLSTQDTKDTNIEYDDLAKRTEGYSGADITMVCREAAMRPLRALFDHLDSSCEVDGEEWHKVMAVEQSDLVEAIGSTKTSSDEGMRKRYAEWQKAFGSV
jgi:katanin p60 ATPase-containing subunit A1